MNFVESVETRSRIDERASVQRWERLITEELLAREDLVKNAPAFIRSIVRAASVPPTMPDVRHYRRLMGTIVELSGIHKIFSHATIDLYGSIAVATTHLSRSWTKELAKYTRPDPDSDPNPILRWLAKLMVLASAPSVPRVKEVLTDAGEKWSVLQILPQELTRAVPVLSTAKAGPTPVAFAQLLDGMSDDEFAVGLKNQQLVGIPFAREGKFVMILDHEPRQGEIERLAHAHPEVLLQTFRMLGPSGRLDEMSRNKIAQFIVTNPRCVTDDAYGAPAFLQLIKDSTDPNSPVREVLSRAVGRLNIPWTSEEPFDIILNMPEDRNFLTLAANAVLGQARRIVSGRLAPGAEGDYDTPQKAVGRMFPDPGSVLALADDPSASDDVRASAILLSALHPRGGVDVLFARQGELTNLAAASNAVAPAVALIIEVHRAYERPEASAVLSAILEANPDARHVPSDTQSYVLVDVLHRWRERSRAPVTTGGYLAIWLT